MAVTTSGALNYTATQDGVYYVHVEASADRGLRAQYLLDVSLTDRVAPVVTGTNLADEGGTKAGVVDRFTLTFSEDLAAATVNDPSHLELQAAGTNDLFDSEDVRLYTLQATGYSSGLSAEYRIDGPL